MKKCRNFFKRTLVTILSLSMIFTSLDLDGFKAIAANSYGDDYNISSILSDFQFFTKENANVSCHTMGAVAVGKTFVGPGQGFADYAFTASYINDWESGVVGNRNYPNTVKTVYYGQASSSVNLDNNCIQNAGYLDMDAAFAEIEKQSAALANMGEAVKDDTIHLNGVNKDVYVTISVDELDSIKFDLDDYSWFNDHILVISVTGVNSSDIAEFPKWGSFFDGDAFKEKFKKDTNAGSVEYNFSGFNFFWNFPDATGTINASCVGGHLIAPKATYSMESSSYQGGIICKEIAKCGGEGHFLPCTLKLPKGDKPKGNLSGYKNDENGVALSGVKFGIYSDKNVQNEVGEAVTNENGYFIFENLEIGEYWVKEKVALPGYYLDDTIYGPYTVNKGDNSIPKTFINTKIRTKANAEGYKVNEAGDKLADAEFTLYSERECQNELKSVKTDSNGKFVFTDIDTTEGGTYYVKETKAPEGYILCNDIYEVSFVAGQTETYLINSGNSIINIEKTGNGTFSKKDNFGNELPGATIEITTQSGKDLSRVKQAASSGGTDVKISSASIKWTSTDKPLVLEGLPDGTYTMHEDDAPAGYNTASDVTFKLVNNQLCDANGNKVDFIQMIDEIKTGKGVFSKVALGKENKELPNAKMEITSSTVSDLSGVSKASNSGGNDVNITSTKITWTSTDKPLVLEGLPDGTYVMHENDAPAGYNTAEDVEFKLVGNVLFDSNGTKVDSIVMKDTIKTGKGTFSKVDVAGDEIPGATIKITSSDVDDLSNVTKASASGDLFSAQEKAISWISTDKPVVLEGLPDGTYVMTETRAPEGYVIAESITFKLINNVLCDANGKLVDSIKMVDELSVGNAAISKQDLGGKELKGAVLKLTSKNVKDLSSIVFSKTGGGEKTDIQKGYISWVSTDEPAVLEGLPDGDYVLSEDTAPLGYEVATDISFKMVKNKLCDANGSAIASVVMKDAPETGSGVFSKKTTGNDELEGAVLTITSSDVKDLSKVTRTSTSGGMKFSATADKISWTSTKEPLVLEGLPNGTYTLHEDTAPAGYNKASDITFKLINKKLCDKNGKEVSSITMIDELKTGSGVFSKKTTGNKELSGAQLTITNNDGKSLASVKQTANSGGDNFSAVGSVISWTSTDVPAEFEGLPDGKYTMHENVAPAGYEYASDITFELKNNILVDANGKAVNEIIMIDEAKKGSAVFSKVDTGNKELSGAHLTLTSLSGTDMSNVKASSTSGGEQFNYSKTSVSWVSTAFDTVLEGLYDGTYKLTETTAPHGYEIAESISFKLINNVVCDMNGNPIDKIVMVDAPKTGSGVFSKQTTGNDELANAKLTITSKDGKDLSKVTKTSSSGGSDLTYGTNSVSWTSTDKPLVLEGLPDGTYVMHEDDAPAGYDVAEDITFMLVDNVLCDEKGNIISSITMIDKAKTGFGKFTKLNDKGASLDGATIYITSSDVADLTSIVKTSEAGVSYHAQKDLISFVTKGGPVVLDGFPDGTYVMHEEIAPEGYEKAADITFKFVNNVLVDVNGSAIDSVTMTDIPKTGSGAFSKKTTGNDELEGATIQITSSTVSDLSGVTRDSSSGGTLFGVTPKMISWVSTDKPVVLNGLPDGEYTMHEYAAPEGYQYAADITFRLNKNVLFDANGNKVDTILMYDEVTTGEASISKTDIAGKELKGAKIYITSKDGFDFRKASKLSSSGGTDFNFLEDKVVWTSTDKPAVITGLPDGTYVLHENDAPAGYEIAESITFKMVKNKVCKEDGTPFDNDTVVMVDKAKTSGVVFSKQDVGGEEVEGATIEIKSKNGKNLDGVKQGSSSGGTLFSAVGDTITFVSTDKPVVLENLPWDDYVLTETNAPKGYEYAESINFTIMNDKVYVDGKIVDKIIMVDKLKTGEGVFSKVDTGNKEVIGAKLRITRNDGKDLSEATRVSGGENFKATSTEITWTSNEEKLVIKGLYDGVYTLHEDYAPEEYEIANEIEFMLKDNELCDKDGNKVSVITMVDEFKTAEGIFSKQNVSGEEIEGATLKLTTAEDIDLSKVSHVETSGGKLFSINSTFITWVSTDKSAVLKGLPDGTYTLKETNAPEGYEYASDITFTIKDNKIYNDKGEEVTTIVMIDEAKAPKPSESSISKKSTDGELPGARLSVTSAKGDIDLTSVTVKEGSGGTDFDFGKYVVSWTSTDKIVILAGLPDGDYILSEDCAPAGYEISTSMNFKMIDGDMCDENGKVIDCLQMIDAKMKDPLKSSLSGYKTDGSNGLAGAVIGLYSDKSCTKEVSKVTSASDGLFTFADLEDGTYFVKEITAPDGYELNTKVFGPYDLADGKSTSMTDKIVDNPYCALTGKKVDENGKALAGATIGLYTDAACKNRIQTKVSGSDGMFKFDHIIAGTYYVKEVTPPSGYVVSDDVFGPYLVENGKTVTMEKDIVNKEDSSKGTDGENPPKNDTPTEPDDKKPETDGGSKPKGKGTKDKKEEINNTEKRVEGASTTVSNENNTQVEATNEYVIEKTEASIPTTPLEKKETSKIKSPKTGEDNRPAIMFVLSSMFTLLAGIYVSLMKRKNEK